MKSKTNFNSLSSFWNLLKSNFNLHSKVKTASLLTLFFLIICSCTKEEATTNQCDAQIEQLSNILIDKSNAFAANQSVSNCQSYRTAYLNLYNKMTQCGYPTTSLNNDYDYVQGLDCSIFDGENGGNTSTGTAMIWTQVDHGCGPISVTVNGSTQAVSSYYSSGAPSCGANGCASFTLPPGTYSVSASCSSATWSGSITVTSGGCSKLRLDS